MKLTGVAIEIALAAVLCGCGIQDEDECPKELRVSITYAAQPGGVFYGHTVVDGELGGGTSGEVTPGGGFETRGHTLDGCFNDSARGGYVEGWVDLDGDDDQRCPCKDTTSTCFWVYEPSCHPEPGDPQGKTEFKLRGASTKVALNIVD